MFNVTVLPRLFQDDKISLLRRFINGYRDRDSVPARHLDGGETVRAAAVREAEEVMGLQAENKEIFFSSAMLRYEGDEQVDFYRHARAWRGEPVNHEPDQCDDLHMEMLFPCSEIQFLMSDR